MRGSIHYQILAVFNESGIFVPGQSKHCAKQLARSKGNRGSHDVSKQIGIFSYATAGAYLDIWHQCASYIRHSHGVKKIENITPDHIKDYLCQKIERQVAYSTFQLESSALQKFERALNLFSFKHGLGVMYCFDSAINEASEIARKTLIKKEHARAYRNPYAIINALDGMQKLCGLIQVQGGARIHEVSLLKESQMRGMDIDTITQEPRGVIHLMNTKGGLPRDIRILPETYDELRGSISDRGLFSIDVNSYRRALMTAASQTGQTYQSTHGFRWNYAHTRFKKCMDKGFTYEEALTIVSKEMGHRRSFITLHYLVPTVE
ncbi:MAG: hypothetical protein NT178_15925 [Proteobacteria bacterium]|nr:hypothetical protein [Pseudomonadota bacterium]